jgi:hypothetical protein
MDRHDITPDLANTLPLWLSIKDLERLVAINFGRPCSLKSLVMGVTVAGVPLQLILTMEEFERGRYQVRIDETAAFQLPSESCLCENHLEKRILNVPCSKNVAIPTTHKIGGGKTTGCRPTTKIFGEEVNL